MQQNRTNGRMNAVTYTRVSSKEQEREGFSIQAQQELLRKYAHDAGIVVLAEFEDVESASVTGRTGFGEMLAFLGKNRTKCQTILVEKTDRLYRNLKDYVTLEDAGVTVHFVKENNVLAPDARSSDQFIHGIKVLMARNYSQNLGEETRKGMLQKARAGMYPSYAPLGYRNVEGPDNRRIIIPDADASTITRLFQEFSTGAYSLKALAQKARKEGLTLRGKPVYKSELHQILRKRVYMGEFDWDGVTYKGSHESIVNREVWERVQAVLNKRVENKQHRIKHDFTFTGFIQCGHCGCQLVGELKKGKYVYYHCTGHKGKCPEPYTREEAMQDQLATALRDLVIPQDVLNWLTEVVGASDLNEQAARERALNKIEEQHRRLQAKLEAMYEDKLEGRITVEFYDRKAKEIHSQAGELLRKANDVRAAAPAPVEDAINVMDLTSRTADLFNVQPVHEQQRFLRLVLKSASWKGGELQTQFEEPFESLRCSNQLSQTKHKAISVQKVDSEIWLPKNTELQIILSRFLNVSGDRDGFELHFTARSGRLWIANPGNCGCHLGLAFAASCGRPPFQPRSHRTARL